MTVGVAWEVLERRGAEGGGGVSVNADDMGGGSGAVQR